jgi:L-gulonate 5-dehydrogenase
MRSVAVEGPHRIAVVERETAEPGPGEVRVRVRYAGICGSDVHILHGKNPFVVYPRVIGHELFGQVEAVGPGVPTRRVGERVAVDPVIACGSCRPCSLGRPNVCLRLQVLGVHRDGGFSEGLCAPAANAHPVPPEIADADAATLEPFAVAANVTSRTGVLANDVALVYGAGPMGLMVLQVLKAVYGIHVLVADRIEERLSRATACGADSVINTAQEPLPEALRRLGLEEGPTLIVDAACHPAILQEAVRVAAPGGRIGILGFAPEPSAISQQEMTRKELSLFSSRLSCAMFPRAIEWMRAGRLKPALIVSHLVPLGEVHRAFEFVEGDPRASSKVLLDMAPEA